MEVQGEMGQSWCGSPMNSSMWTETKKCVWKGNGVWTLLRVNPINCQREDKKRYTPNEFIELGGNAEWQGQKTSEISTTKCKEWIHQKNMALEDWGKGREQGLLPGTAFPHSSESVAFVLLRGSSVVTEVAHISDPSLMKPRSVGNPFLRGVSFLLCWNSASRKLKREFWGERKDFQEGVLKSFELHISSANFPCTLPVH